MIPSRSQPTIIDNWLMKKTILSALLLAVFCGVVSVSAKPSAANVAKAAGLAEEIKNPAAKAALQCRIAFAAATVSIPVNNEKDTPNTRKLWSSYLEKLKSINVSACSEDLKTAFDAHVKAVQTLLGSLTDRPSDGGKFMGDAVTHLSSTYGVSVRLPNTAGGKVDKKYNALPDCDRTYQAVFAAANKSMSKTGVSKRDGELAGQVDKVLGE